MMRQLWRVFAVNEDVGSWGSADSLPKRGCWHRGHTNKSCSCTEMCSMLFAWEPAILCTMRASRRSGPTWGHSHELSSPVAGTCPEAPCGIRTAPDDLRQKSRDGAVRSSTLMS